MEQKKKKEVGVIVFLVLAVIAMTVGFALYTQTLNINGTVTVKGSPWNVHFVNETITPTGTFATATDTLSDTNFQFNVTLNKPGDSYVATINVINEGSINAVLKSITLSNDHPEYVTYSVQYNNDTTYTSTTSGLSTSLPAGATHPVKVTVTYYTPASSESLPSSDTTVTVTGSLYYESAS